MTQFGLIPCLSRGIVGLTITAASAFIMGATFPAIVQAQTKSSLPADSIYQLQVPLTDQGGRQFQLDERRGHPMLVTMFYTSCQFVCPMVIDALRATEGKLTQDERDRLLVLMVSFDPEHDSVAVLGKTASERHLDKTRWTLARTNARMARKLSAALGIQYRALPNGEFNHSTALILIDSDGRIAGRTAKLGTIDAEFVKAVKSTLQSTPPSP